MRNKWLALLLLITSCAMAQDYKIAQPGYRLRFHATTLIMRTTRPSGGTTRET